MSIMIIVDQNLNSNDGSHGLHVNGVEEKRKLGSANIVSTVAWLWLVENSKRVACPWILQLGNLLNSHSTPDISDGNTP
jgi:hypothetical protein